MKYSVSNLSDGTAEQPPQVLDLAQVPALLNTLMGRPQALHVCKDGQNWLELGFVGKGVAVTEQFGGKRFHLRGVLTVADAVGLVGRYHRESVAESIAWYPSLLEWRGLRFKHPGLFSLLNECYRIESALAMSVIVGIGVVLAGAGFWLAMMLGHGSLKAAIIPVVPYALLLAKRVEFVDRSKRGYDYKR